MTFKTLKYSGLLFMGLALGCKEEQKLTQPAEMATVVQEIVSPAGPDSSLPHLVSNEKNTFLSWVETEGDSISILKYSALVDDTWQEPQIILKGDDWFVNWADYPMITENKGNLWSHVLKKSSAGTYSYDVKMNVLPEGAPEWKTNLPLHTDGTPTEHGFVSVMPYKGGFFVDWLDGRNTQENEVGERGAMTLRAGAVSTDGELLQEWELDARTCDCCQTCAVLTDNGPVVLYRDRSEDEIRDIYVVRLVNGVWTEPQPIHSDNWQIKGCPVNGPRAVAEDNNLAVAWFTGAQQKPKVQVIFSNDGGATFQEPILIAEGTVMGRVDIVWLNAKTAAVSWMETVNGKARFSVAKVSTAGEVSKKQLIVEMNDSRKSGFPQMELKGDTIYVAWTDQLQKTTKVKTAKIAVNAL